MDDPELLPLVSKHLPFGWKPASGLYPAERSYSISRSGRRRHTLVRDNETLAKSLKISLTLEALEHDARMFVAEHARRRVFVHAAVVGWTGRAIIIPGESMSGKTSLAAEFVRAGASYYSDEYAVFDERGRVHPYAKPLSIRSIADGYRQTDYPVEAFGGRAGSRPLPVGVVLITKYREQARWRPRVVSLGMGAMA
jgi:hypothetical protein